MCKERIKKQQLTVRTSVGLQSESDPTTGIPFQRDQADIASDHEMLELVVDHAVSVAVTWKCLENKSQQRVSQFSPCLYSCLPPACEIPLWIFI